MTTPGLAEATHPFPVLVMNYDQMLTDMMREVLSLEGYRATAMTRGQACLEHLARHREPHILAIQQFWTLQGDLHVLRYLRGNPPLRRRLAVIVCGAYTSIDEYVRKTAPFAASILQLPFDIDHMITVFASAEERLVARLRARGGVEGE
jgi:DNA-binding NtrC family response regulator